MLHPVGPAAERVATLWWVMFGVYGVIFLLTLGLLALGLGLARREQLELRNGFIVITGIVVPTLILTVMLIYTIEVTRAGVDREPSFRVEVIGHRWWWEVRYPDYTVVDANELHLPAGELVELELRSADVIHSFWVPNLAGKMDMFPEHKTVLQIQADRPGVFRGQCAEYCGTQHALMAFRVVAHERGELDDWLARAERAERGERGQEPALARGRAVFLDAGCGECHRVAGVSVGNAGPDLTLIGGRLTIAAGVFPNTDEHLGWFIEDPQSMKPGTKMPPASLRPDDLQALVAYMRSLD